MGRTMPGILFTQEKFSGNTSARRDLRSCLLRVNFDFVSLVPKSFFQASRGMATFGFRILRFITVMTSAITIKTDAVWAAPDPVDADAEPEETIPVLDMGRYSMMIPFIFSKRLVNFEFLHLHVTVFSAEIFEFLQGDLIRR